MLQAAPWPSLGLLRGSHSEGRGEPVPTEPSLTRACSFIREPGGGRRCGLRSESRLCPLSSSIEIGYPWIWSGGMFQFFTCALTQSSCVECTFFFWCICFQSLCVFHFASFLYLQHVCSYMYLIFLSVACFFFRLQLVFVVAFVFELALFLKLQPASPHVNALGDCSVFALVSHSCKWTERTQDWGSQCRKGKNTQR